MIPWTAFQDNCGIKTQDRTSQGPPEHQKPLLAGSLTNYSTDVLEHGCSLDGQSRLQEHRVIQIEEGPNMASFVLNSPMLELAHERRFVITQLGANNSDFEIVHTRRIGECLTVLDRYFQLRQSDEQCCLDQPPSVEYVGLWTLEQSTHRWPKLEISELPCPPATSPAEHQIMPLSPTSTISPYDRSNIPAVPSLIDVEESEMSEDFDVSAKHVRFFPDIPRAAYSNKLRGARQCRGARLRKRFGDRKKSTTLSDAARVDGMSELVFKQLSPMSSHSIQCSKFPSTTSLDAPMVVGMTASQDLLQPTTMPPAQAEPSSSLDIR